MRSSNGGGFRDSSRRVRDSLPSASRVLLWPSRDLLPGLECEIDDFRPGADDLTNKSADRGAYVHSQCWTNVGTDLCPGAAHDHTNKSADGGAYIYSQCWSNIASDYIAVLDANWITYVVSRVFRL